MILKKSHFALTIKMKDTWSKSTTDLNDIDHVAKQIMDGILTLILDVIDVMK